MFKRLSFLIPRGFLAKTLTLVLGTGLAQVITVVTLPILTRLYTPEEFGLFSLYLVVASTASLVACLCYEPAIMLPEDEDHAIVLLVSAGAIAVVVAALTAAVLWLGGHRLAVWLGAPDLVSVLWWAPVTIFVLGASQALTYWTTRVGRFKVLSMSRIWQSGISAAAQVAAGVVGTGVAGLAAGYLLGLAVGTGVLALTAIGPVGAFARNRRHRVTEYMGVLYRYRDFPLYSTWGDMMNALGFQVVPVALSNFFGTAAVGLYFLAYRVVSLPMSLVGASVKQVVLHQASALTAQRRDLSHLVERVLGKSILFMGLPWLVLALVSPYMFPLVFGAKWATAGTYVQVLAPLGFLQLVTSPISVVLIILQRLRLTALIQAALLIGALGSLALAAQLFRDPVSGLRVYSGVLSLLYLGYLLIIVRESSASSRGIIRAVFFLKTQPQA